MNLSTSPLRKLVTVAASASIMATSFAFVGAPAVAPAALKGATTCVQEEGSATVYPSLIQAQSGLQGTVILPQPAWATGQKLGCDAVFRATGSGNGKTAVISYLGGGTTRRDIAASSAPLSSSEIASLMAWQVGGDGMVIVVREDNPVTNIKMAEVTAIYNGNITDWSQLSAPNGKSGAFIPRARIAGSGTRDDMNRLFKMDRGTSLTPPTCSPGFTTCEPLVIAATGLPRFTTSEEEAESVCASDRAIAYTSLVNLNTYGPGGSSTCTNGFRIKALNLQFTNYATFTGATLNNPLSLPSSGAFVAPSTTSAAAGGTYPAKRQLFLAMGLVSKLVAKYGTGNGTGWTDDLGTTKAFDVVNYMSSTQGQNAMGAVNFITINVPTKQPVPDADIDLNGGIGLTDIGQITGRWNRTDPIEGSVRADVDNNGGVGLSDIGKITGQWGGTGFQLP